jgi:hypothetical protein
MRIALEDGSQTRIFNYNSGTMVTELGHVRNDLLPGASQITADNGNSTQSQNNTLKILQDCNLVF